MMDNISMLRDTLAILAEGSYYTGGKEVRLKLSPAEMKEISVYLPEDIRRIDSGSDNTHINRSCVPVGVSCENTDSFALARALAEKYHDTAEKDARPVLVLNLANPVNPGGGVRRGARAQEEDLCRKSSLLLSLESSAASVYYEYNRSLNTYMGSDAVMITPQVEIIRDEYGKLLPESVTVSVMTCAAPMLTFGKEGMNEQQYRDMLFRRISGMLTLAAHLGYTYLVLGAFGCGAFRNDAAVVSDLFCKAMQEFEYGGRKLNDCFRRIDFAVLDRTLDQYNYKEFSRNFDHFDHGEKAAADARQDRIRGSLFGGAVGDALGYPVEFLREGQLFSCFGDDGITEYTLTDGKARISDDTQMTLFTANGILVGETRSCTRGIAAEPRHYVALAYADWLKTQYSEIKDVARHRRNAGEDCQSWLLDVPELYAWRAPGNTCLSALEERQPGDHEDDYIAAPVNHSKGCGGVMRIAPLALRYRPGETYFEEPDSLDREAAQLAAITHGHSLGYMPAAVVSHVISRCITSAGEMTLKEMILEAKEAAMRIFAGDRHLAKLTDIIDEAVRLSGNDTPDLENIHALGEGWVAEETMGIALYCALKYQNDFSKAVTVSVNHRGDSDSTGAVTGNILGALLGYSAIEDKWKKDLELADVILEMADDLYRGCPVNNNGLCDDPAWVCKYIDMHRYQSPSAPAAPSFTFFWKDDEENGEFSNWYRRPFVIDDFEYQFVEQYMMAQKAKLFHDSRRYTQILRSDDPYTCKKLGKQVTPFDPAVWDAVKYEIVKAGNRAKYEQNADLKNKLLKTGNSIMAEASPKDDIWGIKLDSAAAAAMDPKDWPGQNLLGKALMELRAEFAERKQ